jgi:hypothetical protein
MQHVGSNIKKKRNWANGFLEKTIKIKEQFTYHTLQEWSFYQDHKLSTFTKGGLKDRSTIVCVKVYSHYLLTFLLRDGIKIISCLSI